jgi:tripartite-type tricarboxylate transporter receptor subunit TctC
VQSVSLRAMLAVLTIVTLSARQAKAQAVAEFYKGKTVTMLVGGSPGGGNDVLARALADFMAKRIPGNPSIVVTDMPGAGGMVAMNYLFAKAEPDGTVIGLVENNTPLEPLFGTEEARYDPTKFGWLGTPSIEVSLVLVWHTVAVNSLDDLKTRVTTMGANGAHSAQAFDARLLNETLGTRMQVINGYKGLNDIFLAMERGELDGFPNLYYSGLTSTRPGWLPQHLAKAILQYGPERLKELPDVPFAPDLVANPDDKLLMQAALAPQALGRPLVMPPGAPVERVAALRQALADTFDDPAFKAAADKLGLIVNAPRSGQQLQGVIDQAYAAPPRVIDRLRKLANP